MTHDETTAMTDDDLDALLRALPSDDLDGVRRERTRELAQRELALSPPHPSVYHRVLEPTLVAAVVLLHLGWAVGAVLAVLR
ncbi:MAG: hypothetical protein MUE69_22165 [Myxococcota bacterium]|jgi:hypothetical protein|nr:hypothetical protein [Myxococcota bacterium]